MSAAMHMAGRESSARPILHQILDAPFFVPHRSCAAGRPIFPKDIKAFAISSACLAGALICLFPRPALANAGVPMIVVTMPLMLVALVPIILIESHVLRRRLQVSFRSALASSTVANAVSTLLGIPVTWAVLVALQVATGGGGIVQASPPFEQVLSVTWQAPWLIPYEEDLPWMVSSATLVLLVPFFLMSWIVEYLLVRRRNRDIPAAFVKAACFWANLFSYMLLALVPMSFLFGALSGQVG